jgi:hypothetical protein
LGNRGHDHRPADRAGAAPLLVGLPAAVAARRRVQKNGSQNQQLETFVSCSGAGVPGISDLRSVTAPGACHLRPDPSPRMSVGGGGRRWRRPTAAVNVAAIKPIQTGSVVWNGPWHTDLRDWNFTAVTPAVRHEVSGCNSPNRERTHVPLSARSPRPTDPFSPFKAHNLFGKPSLAGITHRGRSAEDVRGPSATTLLRQRGRLGPKSSKRAGLRGDVKRQRRIPRSSRRRSAEPPAYPQESPQR